MKASPLPPAPPFKDTWHQDFRLAFLSAPRLARTRGTIVFRVDFLFPLYI